MGLFKSSRLFYNAASYTDTAASNLMTSLRYEGFEVDGIKLPSGDWDISVKKGNLFKAILGLQTALKITISPAHPHVLVKAGIGILGQQAIPAVLTFCVGWIFAIPQLWGIYKQCQFDELVMNKLQNKFNALSGSTVAYKDIN